MSLVAPEKLAKLSSRDWYDSEIYATVFGTLYTSFLVRFIISPFVLFMLGKLRNRGSYDFEIYAKMI